MKEGPVDRERAVVAYDQAPEVTEPSVGAFDNPASAVAPQALGRLASAGLFRPCAVRHDQFDPALPQSLRSGSLS